MKIRTDFVTNSSSSSYVIGKYEDTHVTVDYVYQLIRSLHMEALEIQKKITEYLGTDRWHEISFWGHGTGDEIEREVFGTYDFIDKFEVNIYEHPYCEWYKYLKKPKNEHEPFWYSIYYNGFSRCIPLNAHVSSTDDKLIHEMYAYIRKKLIGKTNINIDKMWCEEPDESGKTVLVIEYGESYFERCTVNINSAPVKELMALIGVEKKHIHETDEESISSSFWWIYDSSCLEYETYEDYCRYSPSDEKFTIVDYSVPQKTRCGTDEESTDSQSAVLQWYNYAVRAAFCSLGNNKDCANCHYCDGDSPECQSCIHTCFVPHNNNDRELKEIHRCRELIREKNIPEELACLYFLGRVCVLSYDGGMDYWVAEKLEQIAEHGCTHMG